MPPVTTSVTTSNPTASTDKPRLTVSLTQVTAGALAAVTAALVGSQLGVAGTLLGAAVGSVVATLGAALYGHFLGRTATHVKTVVVHAAPVQAYKQRLADPVAADRDAPSAVIISPEDTATTHDAITDVGTPVDAAEPTPVESSTTVTVTKQPAPRWKLVTMVAATTFIVAVAAITMLELVIGEPLSSLTGSGGGGGTTIGEVVRPPAATTEPTITPTTEAPTTEPTTPPTSQTPTETTTPPVETTEPTTPPTTPPPTTEQATTPPTTPPPTTP